MAVGLAVTCSAVVGWDVLPSCVSLSLGSGVGAVTGRLVNRAPSADDLNSVDEVGGEVGASVEAVTGGLVDTAVGRTVLPLLLLRVGTLVAAGAAVEFGVEVADTTAVGASEGAVVPACSVGADAGAAVGMTDGRMVCAGTLTGAVLAGTAVGGSVSCWAVGAAAA